MANKPSCRLGSLLFKDVAADGAILELVIWKVPELGPPSEYDSMHCAEMPYAFTGVDQSIEDFIAAVDARWKP